MRGIDEGAVGNAKVIFCALICICEISLTICVDVDRACGAWIIEAVLLAEGRSDIGVGSAS